MTSFHLLLIILGCFWLSYLPGRALLAATRLSIKEKFAASFGCSFIIFYLLEFGIYILHLDSWQFLTGLWLVIFAISILFLVKKPFTREELTYLTLFFIAFLVVVAIQGLLPYYVGGTWYYDWYEHYKRTQFFLDHAPLSSEFGSYLISSRPPLFNLVAAFFQSVAGKDFWVFQIVSSLLNLTVVLPCFLLVSDLVAMKTRLALFALILGILLLNPAFIVETTFTWSKYLSVAYVLSGFYFYLRFRASKTPLYLFFTSLFLASAYLTHYSAAPYILAIGCDFGLQALFVTQKIRKYIIICLSIFIVLTSTWFTWSIFHFGWYETFLGNTSFAGQFNTTLGYQLNKNFNNFRYTFLPYISLEYFKLVIKQKYFFPIFYDLSFALYATTLPGQLTFTMCFGLLIYLRHRLRRKNFWPQSWFYLKSANWPKMFKQILNHPYLPWGLFLSFGLVLGLVLLPSAEMIGSIQVIYLPLSMAIWSMAVMYFIRQLHRISSWFKVVLVTGLVLESILGIGIRIYVSRYDMNPEYLQNQHLSYRQDLLVPVHMDNYMLKFNESLVFLADKYRNLRGMFVVVFIGEELASIALISYLFWHPDMLALYRHPNRHLSRHRDPPHKLHPSPF